jgi:hypothetical protein
MNYLLGGAVFMVALMAAGWADAGIMIVENVKIYVP